MISDEECTRVNLKCNNLESHYDIQTERKNSILSRNELIDEINVENRKKSEMSIAVQS